MSLRRFALLYISFLAVILVTLMAWTPLDSREDFTPSWSPKGALKRSTSALPEERRALLPSAALTGDFPLCTRNGPELLAGTWSPTQATLARLDGDLADFLEESRDRLGDWETPGGRDLTQDYRQYLAVRRWTGETV